MADPDSIVNWRRHSAAITTSGQPSEQELVAIRALSIRHIINLGLHTHPQALADEATSVAALGMHYTHIPVDFAAPREEDFQQFCDAMAAIGDRPVHIHCILNARVTAFMLRYRRDILGEDGREARTIMDSVWRPGGVWAAFVGDDESVGREHAFAGQDYTV